LSVGGAAPAISTSTSTSTATMNNKNPTIALSSQHHQDQDNNNNNMVVVVDNSDSSLRPFYKDLHFWIKFGRMCEFAFMIPGIFSSFANLTVVNHTGKTLITRILLWDGVFCKETLLWLNLFINNSIYNNDNDDMAMDSAIPTFGGCVGNAMFHIQFASLKVVITAGIALVLKRDARRNPLFYLIKK
jgi:hypothetical protein